MNTFSCQCPPGRTGTTCQMQADNPCVGKNQCMNGGTCEVIPATSQSACRCPPRFTGERCEQG